MWLKHLLIFFSFLFLIIFQNIFFPHFNIFGIIPNLFFILFFIISFLSASGQTDNIFDNNQLSQIFSFNISQDKGLFSAIVAGLFLDIFSPIYLARANNFFGGSIILLLSIYVFIKTVIYFFKDNGGKYFILYFNFVFLISIIIYNISYDLYNIYPYLNFNFNKIFFIELAYNLIIANIIFFIYRFTKNDKVENQLKLF